MSVAEIIVSGEPFKVRQAAVLLNINESRAIRDIQRDRQSNIGQLNARQVRDAFDDRIGELSAGNERTQKLDSTQRVWLQQQATGLLQGNSELLGAWTKPLDLNGQATAFVFRDNATGKHNAWLILSGGDRPYDLPPFRRTPLVSPPCSFRLPLG